MTTPTGSFADSLSMGVLAAAIPRDAVNDAITVSRRGAKRSGGKLPPHVMVYYALALALFPDEDYEEVFTRLSATLTSWGCWDPAWEIPTSGGITQARTRLGVEPLAELFDTVATPIADELTPGAFLGSWRLISIDGLEFDAPDTPANITAFGRAGGSGQKASAFAKPRLLTLVECASHAPVAAVIGGQHQGEQTLARDLWPLLEPDWLVIADANFYSYRDYSAAAESGAALVWRLSASVRTPVLTDLGDGSYRSVVFAPRVRAGAREAILRAIAEGDQPDPDEAMVVRVVEYTVPDRGEDPATVVRLVTTVTDPTVLPGRLLAQAYHQRWEHETSNAQLKTVLRGPGRVLRSKSPALVRQEIYGYLLAHYAISSLICRAATEAAIDPDRVKFIWAVRRVRAHTSTGTVFSP